MTAPVIVRIFDIVGGPLCVSAEDGIRQGNIIETAGGGRQQETIWEIPV